MRPLSIRGMCIRTNERIGCVEIEMRTTSRGCTWHHIGQPRVGSYRTRRRLGKRNAIKRMIRILRSCAHDVMRKRMQ